MATKCLFRFCDAVVSNKFSVLLAQIDSSERLLGKFVVATARALVVMALVVMTIVEMDVVVAAVVETIDK